MEEAEAAGMEIQRAQAERGVLIPQEEVVHEEQTGLLVLADSLDAVMEAVVQRMLVKKVEQVVQAEFLAVPVVVAVVEIAYKELAEPEPEAR